MWLVRKHILPWVSFMIPTSGNGAVILQGIMSYCSISRIVLLHIIVPLYVLFVGTPLSSTPLLETFVHGGNEAIEVHYTRPSTIVTLQM